MGRDEYRHAWCPGRRRAAGVLGRDAERGVTCFRRRGRGWRSPCAAVHQRAVSLEIVYRRTLIPFSSYPIPIDRLLIGATRLHLLILRRRNPDYKNVHTWILSGPTCAFHPTGLVITTDMSIYNTLTRLSLRSFYYPHRSPTRCLFFPSRHISRCSRRGYRNSSPSSRKIRCSTMIGRRLSIFIHGTPQPSPLPFLRIPIRQTRRTQIPCP